MKKVLIVLTLLLFLVITDQSVSAQSIATDRPGFFTAPYVVSTGTLQLESGIQLNTGDGYNSMNIGQLLLRYGFGAWELRGELNSWNSFSPEGGGSTSGFDDLGVGAKVRLYRGKDLPVNADFLGSVSFPTGSRGFTKNDPGFEGQLLVDITALKSVIFTVNLGYSDVLRQDGAGQTLFSLTGQFGLGFKRGMAAYLGLVGLSNEFSDTQYVEYGTTIPMGSWQWDVYGGNTTDFDDLFVGTGIAFKILN